MKLDWNLLNCKKQVASASSNSVINDSVIGVDVVSANGRRSRMP
jgi:hypothetical protein